MTVVLFYNVQLRLLNKCLDSSKYIYFFFLSLRRLTIFCNVFKNVCFHCLKFISVIVVVVVNAILVSFVSLSELTLILLMWRIG